MDTIEPSGSGTQPSSAAGAGRLGPAVHELVLGLKIWVLACRWSLATIRPSFRCAVPVSHRLPYSPDWPSVHVFVTGLYSCTPLWSLAELPDGHWYTYSPPAW